MWVNARRISYFVYNNTAGLGLGDAAVARSARLVGVVWPVLLKVAASATRTYSNTGHRHVNCSP